MSTTKADLVEVVAEEVGPKITKKDVGVIVDKFIDSICRTLAEGKRIEIRGFGVFKTKVRKEKLGRNPKTREPVNIPSRLVPVFKPSRLLRSMVTPKPQEPQSPQPQP